MDLPQGKLPTLLEEQGIHDIPEIPPETGGFIAPIHHQVGTIVHPVETQHPWQWIIPFTIDESLTETGRPVLVAGLITVDQHMLERSTKIAAQLPLQWIQHRFPVKSGLNRIQLIHLQCPSYDIIRQRMRVR